MAKWLVDRIEGDFVVIEDEKSEFYNIPKGLLPNVQEGDSISVEILSDNSRKQIVGAKLNRLFTK